MIAALASSTTALDSTPAHPVQLMQTAFKRLSAYLPAFLAAPYTTSPSTSSTLGMPARARLSSEIYSTRPEWQAQLDSLPSLEQTGGKIPSIFLAHGRKYI